MKIIGPLTLNRHLPLPPAFNPKYHVFRVEDTRRLLGECETNGYCLGPQDLQL